jgi:hypothetical protein
MHSVVNPETPRSVVLQHLVSRKACRLLAALGLVLVTVCCVKLLRVIAHSSSPMLLQLLLMGPQRFPRSQRLLIPTYRTLARPTQPNPAQLPSTSQALPQHTRTCA